MKKAKVKMNKQLCLGTSILIISKTLMYELTLMYNIFTEDFFEDINNDVERWFDASNYDKNDKRIIK